MTLLSENYDPFLLKDTKYNESEYVLNYFMDKSKTWNILQLFYNFEKLWTSLSSYMKIHSYGMVEYLYMYQSSCYFFKLSSADTFTLYYLSIGNLNYFLSHDLLRNKIISKNSNDKERIYDVICNTDHYGIKIDKTLILYDLRTKLLHHINNEEHNIFSNHIVKDCTDFLINLTLNHENLIYKANYLNQSIILKYNGIFYNYDELSTLAYEHVQYLFFNGVNICKNFKFCISNKNF